MFLAHTFSPERACYARQLVRYRRDNASKEMMVLDDVAVLEKHARSDSECSSIISHLRYPSQSPLSNVPSHMAGAFLIDHMSHLNIDLTEKEEEDWSALISTAET